MNTRVTGAIDVNNGLQALETRPVVHLDEGKPLRVAPGTHPTIYLNRINRSGRLERLLNFQSLNGHTDGK
jgi:hypothetical protein